MKGEIDMHNRMVRFGRNDLANELDYFYDNFFGNSLANDTPCCFSPAVDIHETKDNVSLIFELPGMDKKDIKVWVENNVLTVSGERQLRREEKDKDYLRAEIRNGSFSRSFTLPESIDATKISADYKNGLLTVTLARAEEAKPKEIEVKVN